MLADLRNGFRSLIFNYDLPTGGVISVAAHIEPKQSLGIFLPGLVEIAEWRLSFTERDNVQICERFAVQPIGAPVRCEIGAVAPDRALLHPTHRLPDGLTTLDIGACEQRLARLGLHGLGNRWGSLIDFAAKIEQRREHHGHTGCEYYP